MSKNIFNFRSSQELWLWIRNSLCPVRKTDKHAVMKSTGRNYSASDLANHISAAYAGFGVHISTRE